MVGQGRVETVVTSHPSAVKNIRNDDILLRVPCINQASPVQRSLLSTLIGHESTAVACSSASHDDEALDSGLFLARTARGQERQRESMAAVTRSRRVFGRGA